MEVRFPQINISSCWVKMQVPSSAFFGGVVIGIVIVTGRKQSQLRVSWLKTWINLTKMWSIFLKCCQITPHTEHNSGYLTGFACWKLMFVPPWWWWWWPLSHCVAAKTPHLWFSAEFVLSLFPIIGRGKQLKHSTIFPEHFSTHSTQLWLVKLG